MTIRANVLLCRNEFIAELSDGRKIEDNDLRAFSLALHRAGVQAKDMHCNWRTGHRILTAGQQVAMKAELRRLEQAEHGCPAEPHVPATRSRFALAA